MNTSRLRRTSFAPALLSAALLPALLLVGCASPSPQPTASVDANAPFAEPITIDNCGFDLTVTAPPQRVITIKSTSTELLLSLGLGDRIIGQAFADGPIPASIGDVETGDVEIPVISDFAPSQEAVLDLEPDFIVAGWESNLTADAAGEREELSALGIGSYVSPAACKDPAYKPAKLSFENIFDYIAETGAIFGVNDAADELVQSQRALLASIEPSTEGLTALWWSSGNDAPYVGAGIGAPQLVLETAGLTNIAGTIDDTWSSLNWEAIIAANPDVIVLVDATWNTAESKREFLATNPATAALPAVINERYIVIPFASGEAGVRSVEAAAFIAEQLAALG